jgi:hypothetical protein
MGRLHTLSLKELRAAPSSFSFPAPGRQSPLVPVRNTPRPGRRRLPDPAGDPSPVQDSGSGRQSTGSRRRSASPTRRATGDSRGCRRVASQPVAAQKHPRHERSGQPPGHPAAARDRINHSTTRGEYGPRLFPTQMASMPCAEQGGAGRGASVPKAPHRPAVAFYDSILLRQETPSLGVSPNARRGRSAAGRSEQRDERTKREV